MVRYPWYAASLAVGSTGWLTWARYTLFIPLYPAGVAAEIWLLYSGLPWIDSRRLHSVALPNILNFAFSYKIFTTVPPPPLPPPRPSTPVVNCVLILKARNVRSRGDDLTARRFVDVLRAAKEHANVDDAFSRAAVVVQTSCATDTSATALRQPWQKPFAKQFLKSGYICIAAGYHRIR